MTDSGKVTRVDIWPVGTKFESWIFEDHKLPDKGLTYDTLKEASDDLTVKYPDAKIINHAMQMYSAPND